MRKNVIVIITSLMISVTFTSCLTPALAVAGVIAPAGVGAIVGSAIGAKEKAKKEEAQAAKKTNETAESLAEPIIEEPAIADSAEQEPAPMPEPEYTTAQTEIAQTPPVQEMPEEPEVLPPPVEENNENNFVAAETQRIQTPDSNLNIIELILTGRADEAKALLLENGNMNTADANANTSLHAAAMVNNAELVTWLLDHGADSEVLNNEGNTPLHTSVIYDAKDAAQALVDGNADIIARTKEGKTALSMGIEKGKSFYPAFVIKKAGEVRDVKGQTIVHYFMRTDDIDGMALCIERDLPLDIRDNNGKTPLALGYENKDSATSAALAAALILAGVSPIQGEFAYFENTVKTRNARQNFEDDQTSLHQAVISDHEGIASYLIACGALVNAQDLSGAAPLHLAVRYGRINMVSLLIASGANVNACDSTLKTPLLITAPKDTQNDIYTMLLTNGADASVQDIFGDNALHIATMGSMSTALITKLINSGAIVNTKNKKGLTPLTQAVEQKNVDHIKLYISYGADIFAEDINDNSPLSRCLRDGNLLKILVNQSNMAVTDSYGNTPLHIALAKKATAGSVRYLLDLGIGVNSVNCYGETPIFSALKADNYQGVDQLIKVGAERDFCDNQGNTALHAAVRWAADKSCAKLLADGYDVNIHNQAGKSPLAEAARQNRINIMKQLIAKGADVNSADVTGKTVLMGAIECMNPVAVTLLLQKGASPTQQDVYGRNAFHEAATTGNEALIKLIKNTGTNPLSNDMYGKTPLGIVIHSAAKIIKTLLGTDTTCKDSNANTPLHVAVTEKASEAVISMLIDMKYPVNAQNASGQTALELAVSSGMNTECTLLMKAGADIFITDKNGDNAVSAAFKTNPSILTDMASLCGQKQDAQGNGLLHYAAAAADADVLNVLIQYGASKTIRNNAGLTAADTARQLNRPQSVISALQ